ncbi:GMC family oxidoreductase [Melittangium boletus]|uniref:GMC family oxidoreductase n=1 Tax=Melittangium boletus TaxID=83453 RepID=UPI003DA3024A
MKIEQGHFDYVIVGAGTAGCVVARRLVEGSDARVLLIEAGGSDEGIASISHPARWLENIGAAHDWSYAYESSPHVDNRALFLSRGKVLGGSGSTNGMIWARGNRADYDGWAAAGNAGWDFDSVLPLFKKSEDWEGGASAFRGAGGPIRIERARQLNPVAAALIDACGTYGMPYLEDVNVPHPEGVGPINMNVREGTRCGTARAFLQPVRGHANLTVLTGAQVVSLTLSGTRCTGLELLMAGERQVLHASREVILCAGTIDTPRLLMLSGIGPAEDLRRLDIPVAAALAGVGQNLQEHVILAGLCFEAKQPLPPPHHNLVDSTFFWKSRASLPVPDLMFVPVQLPYVSAEIAAQYPVPSHSFCLAPGLVRVQSRGHVRMKTARHDGPLEIQPRLLAEQADVDALVAGLELGLDIASQPAFREIAHRWVAPPKRLSREEAVAFVRRASSPYFHPVGTCAMGSGEAAVVDARLRVHGLEGLRIADASVMPTIPSAGTLAPTVMIAEFASRQLLADRVG